MRLWTIQREEAFRRFEAEGVLKGDGRRVSKEFRAPYKWMRQQMEVRIAPPPYRRGSPVWAWKVKPDLRSVGHLPPGSAGLRIECEIEDGQVLVLDFNRWAVVLMQCYVAEDEAEDQELDRRFGEDWENKGNPAARALIEKSWERIFELEDVDSYWWGPMDCLQAVMWQIEWSQVRGVTKFTAR